MDKRKKQKLTKAVADSINLTFHSKSKIDLSNILENILHAVKPVDFEALVKAHFSSKRLNLKVLKMQSINDEKLKKVSLRDNHYVVICIEKLIEIANENKWPICKSENSIFVFNGCFHERVDPDLFKFFLGKVADKMGIEKFKGRFHKFKEELYRQFLSASYLTHSSLSNEDVLINLKNGTLIVNNRNIELRNFDQADFLKYQLNFEYDPVATAPQFLEFLNKVLPDKQKQTVLAEYCGYIFTSSEFIKLEKVLLLLGSGANGKSVFFEILSAILGESNISSCSMRELSNDNYRSAIEGKLLNYSSEMSPNINSELFKKLASSEPVYVKKVYENAYKITNYAKMMFNCNELPNVTENTNAFFRRFLIIHFGITIEKNEMDYSLAKKIISDELPGVLIWILQGLSRLRKQGKLSECSASEEILNKYKRENDTVQVFLDEFNYVPSANKSTLCSKVYLSYKDFCVASGFRFLNALKFSDAIVSRNISKQKKNSGLHYFMEIRES